MNFGKFLDSQLLRNLRNAAATIRAVLFFGAIIVAAAVFLYLALGSDRVDPAVLLTVVIGVAVLAATIFAFGQYNRHFHDPPFYEIVELEGLLIVERVGNHHRYLYTRRQLVKATRDDLRLVEIRGHWTGVGSKENMTIEPLIDDHVLLDGGNAEEDGRVHRWIYPCRSIAKGGRVEVGVSQVHEDDIRPQLPYFREGGGRYRTGKITVTARFSQNEDPGLVRLVEGKVWSSNRPIRQIQPIADVTPIRKTNHQAGTIDYIVTVERPKLYHSYGITWSSPRLSNETK